MEDKHQARDWGRRFFRWWADHPAAHLFVICCVSAAAIIGYVNPSLVRDLFVSRQAEEPSESTPRVAQENGPPPPDVKPFQVAGGECVLVAASEDFFTNESLEAIRNAVADLESLPQVSRVLWLDSIPGLNLFGLPESPLPQGNASPRQLRLGRKRTLDNPLAVGQLISADGKTILLHLRMDWFHVTTDEACTTDLRKTAEAAAARVPGADVRFQV
ncbi:MAG: RND transporter, partial [Planctomycetales bacterium]